MCECSGLCGNKAVDISHSVCAGPCVEAGSRAIWSRECCRGRWARWARRPGSVSNSYGRLIAEDERHANTNQCDQHSAPVRKRYRAPWSQSWCVGLCPGLGGPSVRLGPLRVGESMRERVLSSMRERVLGLSAVWPSVSGRMAFGIWPCGLWTLAAWRGLICARCPCPNGALWWLASARTKRPTMGFSLIGALPGLGQRQQGGRECAVRSSWIQRALGWARQPDRKRFRD